MTGQEKSEIIKTNKDRNTRFFTEEYDKLDRWADDMKLSLEKEIKDLDAEIKLRKAEAGKLFELEQKVTAQRAVKELEKRRNEKRKKLFEAQDEIEVKKDELLNEIEARMEQKLNFEALFTIRWNIQ